MNRRGFTGRVLPRLGALASALALLAAEPCGAAMQLQFREMFGTTGVIDAARPGGFGSVSGAFHQRAGGPRLLNGAAASADLQGNVALAAFSVNHYEQPRIFAGAWFFLKAKGSNNTLLMTLTDASGNRGPYVSEFGGKLTAGLLFGPSEPCPVDPINRWIYVGVAVSRPDGFASEVQFYYRLPGEPLMPWGGVMTGNTANAALAQVRVGAEGNVPVTAFRVGAPSVYTFDEADFSDVEYPQDLIEPVTGLTWYCNPATGNDENDGTSPETAWATAAKVNAESRHAGLFSAPSHAGGDTLVIDTAGADLELAAGAALKFQTQGLNVRAAQGREWVRVKSYRTLAPAAWTATATPNVYATADTQAHVVVWEDDKFMHHPGGANFAAVSAALSSTPGSFWTDGTTLYVHPFGSSDPRTDGKRYERSYLFSDGAAVVLGAPDMNVRDIHAGKTCLAEKVTHDALGGYCMGTHSHMGSSLIKHCYLYYGAKHNLGLVLGKAGDFVVIDDVQAEQGSPYTWAGGQTVFVSFVDGPSDMGIVHSYRNCVTRANAGLIGSTAGVMTAAYPVFYSHNVTGVDQFAKFEFIGCDFGSGGLQGSAVKTVDLLATHCGYVRFGADVELSRCLVEGLALNDAGRTVKARNSLFLVTGMLVANPFMGNVDVRHCTFDASGVTSILGGVQHAALFSRVGALNFIFRSNAVLMPAAPVGANVFSNLTFTDSLDMAGNVYGLSGSVLSYRYDDEGAVANRSLAQWQALGFDAGSKSVADMKWQGYVPQPGSPLLGMAADAAQGEDYSGAVHAVRNDAGAHEVRRTYAHWQAETFDGPELEDAAVSGPGAVLAQNGVTNLLRYALDLKERHPSSQGFPEASVFVDESLNTRAGLIFTRLRDAGDLEYVIEESTDLRSWVEAGEVVESILSRTAIAEKVSLMIDAIQGQRVFLRLKVKLR